VEKRAKWAGGISWDFSWGRRHAGSALCGGATDWPRVCSRRFHAGGYGAAL